MGQTVSFNTIGYDPFIDFIKAYAIICVLIGHTCSYPDYIGYGVWAGMQVPLFVLVQSFHSFKKNDDTINIKRILWRVIIPFVSIEVLTCLIVGLSDHISLEQLWSKIVQGGGLGPGSYYPWIYLQFALILPVFSRFIRKMSQIQLLFGILFVCEAFEVLLSICHFPDAIYRFLAIRYLFLIYFAYIWVEKGVKINIWTVLLSVVSLGTIIYFEYFSIDDEPFFYKTVWTFHRWPCYYYVSVGGIMILHKIYNSIRNNAIVDLSIRFLAKCSYEIFLVQMSVIAIFGAYDILHDNVLQYGLRNIIIYVVSIYGGYLLYKYYRAITKELRIG